jgi:hypothetical protein
MIHWFNIWLTYRLNELLNGWINLWVSQWMCGLLTDWMTDWLPHWLEYYLTEPLLNFLIDSVAEWLPHWLNKSTTCWTTMRLKGQKAMTSWKLTCAKKNGICWATGDKTCHTTKATMRPQDTCNPPLKTTTFCPFNVYIYICHKLK